MKRVLVWPLDQLTRGYEWIGERFFGGNPLFASVGLWLLFLTGNMIAFGNDVGLETIAPLTVVMGFGAAIEWHKYNLNKRNTRNGEIE